MKKTLTLFFTFVLMSGMLIFNQANAAVQIQPAKTKAPYISPGLKPCIVKYKNGDYVGTIQDINALLEKEPNNTYAKYYLALSYTRLGYKEKAEPLYREIGAGTDTNAALRYYSLKAADCLNDYASEVCKAYDKKPEIPVEKLPEIPAVNPIATQQPNMQQAINGVKDGIEEAVDKVKEQRPESDIDKFIKSGKQFHPAAADKITRERMDRKIQEQEYQKKLQEQDTLHKSDASTPTNEEIAAALNTLSKIGMNPYQLNQINPLAAMAQSVQFNKYGMNPFMAGVFSSDNTNTDFTKMFLYSQLAKPQNNILNYGI